jgi:acetoin utilization protein AcuB
MTRNLITVDKNTNILKVKNILKKHNIEQVPVVDSNKLVGIITDRDIRENSASPASTLSTHELNYLLSDMKAESIMTKKVFTVSPGTTIEAAAKIINEKRVNSLPVVVDNEPVGIITTCDLLDILLEFVGMDIPSSRVQLTISSTKGDIAKIAHIINDRGLTIMSIVSTMKKGDPSKRTAVIRVNTDNIKELCEAFKQAGYEAITEYKVEK